jgi:hypothetical protein
MSELRGGCLCGAVRYQARDVPSIVTLCHCSMCRRSVGAQSVAWATVRRECVSIEGDALRWHASSERARRGFCERCGTSLFFEAQAQPEQLDLTVGSLDEPSACPPSCHIFVLDRVAWVPLAPPLPAHVADSDSPLA